ncbi:MAG TPA: hypothetical protein VE685_07175 [Thermoanaerobaculia bacterium]|nr:hypothetical protein [Thermoanaerobaculia bacterium]
MRQAIDARRDALAEAVTARHDELQPELAARYGPAARARQRALAGQAGRG